MKEFVRIRDSAITKINGMFFLLIVATLAFSMYNYMMCRDIGNRYRRSMDLYYVAAGMKDSIKQCDAAMEDYIVSGNRGSLAEHNEAVKEMDRILEACRELVDTPAVSSFLQSISDAFYSYQTAANYGAFSYAETNYYEGSLSYQESREIGRYIQEYCDEILDALLDRNKTYYAQLNKKQNQLLFINLYAVVLLGATAFHTMSGNITRMMEDIRKNAGIRARLLDEQLKNEQYVHRLEQANYLNLQLQTNPHFLFNTLNTISRTVTLGMNGEAVEMIDSMAALLRYNLNDMEEPVPLKEEIQVVREYLHIQGFRFGDRIRAEFDCREELAERVMVPRFSLQPFVENAVIHGLEPKTAPGCVWVRVGEKAGVCIIEIRDDGAGMDPGKLEALNRGEQVGSSKRKSVGVSNAVERLRFFTKDPDAVRIESELGKGTWVTIRIPMEGEVCTN